MGNRITKKMIRRMEDEILELFTSTTLFLFNQAGFFSRIKRSLGRDLKLLVNELENRQGSRG